MRTILICVAASLVLVGCSGPGKGSGASVGSDAEGGGGLADGSYDCSTMGGSFDHPGIQPMGHVEIKGGRFRMHVLDETNPPFSPYSVDPGGAIHWGGPMGGLTDAPSTLLDSTKEDWGFNVKYRLSATSMIDTMSCHLVK